MLGLAVIPYGKRRPVGAPLSWGEAMFAATYAFFVMFIAFGVVPHQWIDHADKNLGWTKDNIIEGPGGILKPQSMGGWNPITLQYEAVRDIVVVTIHAVYFGLIIFLWSWWQKRGQTTSHRDRDQHLRSSPGEEGMMMGPRIALSTVGARSASGGCRHDGLRGRGTVA